MSKRLQVLLDEAEFGEIRKVARRNNLTVAEWVRQALRAARRRVTVVDPHRKLDVVRNAYGEAFPTADIEVMRDQITRGYGEPS